VWFLRCQFMRFGFDPARLVLSIVTLMADVDTPLSGYPTLESDVVTKPSFIALTRSLKRESVHPYIKNTKFNSINYICIPLCILQLKQMQHINPCNDSKHDM